MTILSSLCCRPRRDHILPPHHPPFTNLYANFTFTQATNILQKRRRSVTTQNLILELSVLAHLVMEDHAPIVVPSPNTQIPAIAENIATRLTVQQRQATADRPPRTVWVATAVDQLHIRVRQYVALSDPDGRPLGVAGYISDVVFPTPDTARLSIRSVLPDIIGYIFVPRTTVELPPGSKPKILRLRGWATGPRAPHPPVPAPPAIARGGVHARDEVTAASAPAAEAGLAEDDGKAASLTAQASRETMRGEDPSGPPAVQRERPSWRRRGRGRPTPVVVAGPSRGRVRNANHVILPRAGASASGEANLDFACAGPEQRSTLLDHMAKPRGV